MPSSPATTLAPELASGETTVRLAGERSRWSLRAKDGKALGKALGLELPARIGGTSAKNDALCLCLGPDEWLVIGPPGLSLAQPETLSSVVDVSHRNQGFLIDGPRAAALLSVGIPLDLRDAAFPVGRAARTVFESAPVVVVRTGEHSWHLECWRSFAPYMADFFARVERTMGFSNLL